MIQNLPIFVSIFFGLTTIATLVIFVWIINNSSEKIIRKKSVIIGFGMIIWLLLQAIITYIGVYSTDTYTIPPKIAVFGIIPAFITIIILFSTTKGRNFIDSLPLKNITYLNTIRIPVELVLLWLFLNNTLPEIMTFEGRNFDILAGISAPIIAYFGFTKNKLSKNVILIWNFVCLLLLINIIVIAFLSAPTPFQQFGFGQSNTAILYFPFSWLPTFIVPIVLFGHLVSIRQLLKR